MLRKSEFNLKSALSALKDRGQGGDARQSSRKLTVILSTVLAVAKECGPDLRVYAHCAKTKVSWL